MADRSVNPSGINRDDRPDMRDLSRYIVEQQAAQWERLGLELGLRDYYIANISRDNANRSVICCREMLQKWLEIDPSATWDKLDDAIQNIRQQHLVPAVSTDNSHSTGISSHLKCYYNITRFRVENDVWPLFQPKHYTPLVLVQQHGHWSKEEVKAMAEANRKGHIDEYLFTTGSTTITDLQDIFSDCFDQPVSSDQPRIILVEGAPGVGKSVLMKHISCLWANNQLLTKCDILFLLYLRDPAVHEMKSLHDLVHHFYYHDNVAAEGCMVQITKQGGKFLTILLDGYDEYPYHLQQHSFIADILQCKILPACAIVISSCPHASTYLRSNVTCRIEILGFSEDDKKNFIQQSLENKPDKIPVLNDYLTAHPVISSLCYIPFYMTVLLFLYVQENTLPTSSTELYNLFICFTICRHLARAGITLEEDTRDIDHLLKYLPPSYKNIIKALSKFAYKTLDNNQLMFTRAEIIKMCPEICDTSGAFNEFGLLQAVEYVGLTNRTQLFNFFHLSIQEFLAANYIINLPFDEEYAVLNEKFWKTNHLNMFTFYISLTKGQKSSFRKFLSGGDNTITICDKFLNENLKCIHLYRCFNAASDNDHVCRTFEKKFSNGKISFYKTTLSTNDIENIATFLTHSSIKQWKELNLANCHIRDAGLRIIHRIITSSSVIIEELGLHCNDLSSSSDGCLTDIVITCGVKELSVSYNKTIGQTEEFFCTILSSPLSVIEKLYITGISLSTAAAIMIFSLLKNKETKLRRLSMASNDITDDACDVIAETLKVNSTLEYLDKCGNKISKEAIQPILESLNHNNTLTKLYFPSHYSEDDKKQILTHQDIVNEKRKQIRCQAKLNVKFGIV